MAAVAAIGIGLMQGAAAAGEAEAIEQQTRFEQNRLAFNKKIAEINAQDAIDRGEEQVADFSKEAARMKGAQRAALAAQGINVDTSTAAAIQYETDKQVDTDIARIRNNAWREAWGYKIEATSIGTQSQLTGLAGKNQARSTLAAGGLQAAGSIVQGISSFMKK